MAAAALLSPLLPTPPRSEMLPILPTPPRSEMLPILPTPPRSKMLPLLPTPSCGSLTILPASSTKPGRADSVERWDAHKKYKKPCSPSSSSSDSSGSPGRADSVERWGRNKIKTPTSSSTSSSSSRESSTSPRRATLSSCETGDGKYKRPPSRASSAERWDTHKKPRSVLQAADAKSRTAEQEIKKPQNGETTAPVMIAPTEACTPFFAGVNLFASPEPSMLPMPTFLLAR